MASLLTCVDEDRVRKILLDLEPGEELDWRNAGIYRHYRAYCAQELGGEHLAFEANGVYSWFYRFKVTC